jgi:DNA-binding transcriptional MerR regulator
VSIPRPRNRLVVTSAEPSSPVAGSAAAGAPRPEGDQELFTTGDMARITNTTLRTVRFYEEAGILRPARRSEGGHRLFVREELERLRLASDMREAGLSLDDIRSLLDLKSTATTGGEAARLATAALKDVIASLHAKIEVLQRLSGDLQQAMLHAEACLGCEKAELFPHRCHECEALLAKGPVPRGLRVLWGMPADGPHATDDATAAGEGGAPVGARAG